MTALTIAHRTDAIAAILKAAFEPRFDAIEVSINESLAAHVAALHPRFVELMGDPESRQYVATNGVSSFYTPNELRVAFPNYVCCGLPPAKGWHISSDKFRRFYADTQVPTSIASHTLSEELAAVYFKAWDDYVAAFDKLTDVFGSYKIREKFIVDFPEFEQYLPIVTVRSKLPMVVVSSVRAELTALGVPAACHENT
jgi:hypothetical protein